MIAIKVAERAGGILFEPTEVDMIHPFLALVLAGFGTFMAVLGTVSVRGYIDDLREARARRNLVATAHAQETEAASNTDRYAA